MNDKNDNQVHDLIIIGAGPAGLTAAVYAARYGLDTLVFGELVGGMAAEAYKVCNFPSYGEIGGFELTQKMEKQVTGLGVEIKPEKVVNVFSSEGADRFEVVTSGGVHHRAKKIILATGTEKRKLNIENEEKFLGRGISYCAVCDAAFYGDKTVGVVGGSNAALTAALLLAEFAARVYIIYRRDRFFRAEPAWVELVSKNKKIEPVFNARVTGLIGGDKLEAVRLDVVDDDNKSTIVIKKLDGLFVEIGSVPNTGLGKELKIELGDNGYIKTDNGQRTNVKGVFAAGDVTANPLKQIITAAGEGAIAVNSAYDEMRQ